MASTRRIRIATRLRPRIDGEIDDGAIQVCHASDNTAASSSSASSTTSLSYISAPNPRDLTEVFKFPFNSCYDQASTQEEIFENDVQPMIDVVYSGVTVTVFAYGVTSSGKTHTMQGTKAQPGIIPRAVEALFNKRKDYTQYQTTLAVSYMEIYKDEVYDLLVNRDNAPKLPVRENGAGMVFVANLSSHPLESVEEFNSIYSQATKNRSVGATNLNRASSRSHAVLTIEVTLVDSARNTTLKGKMNLVDLAGSENNKMTGNDATRMQESAAINKSLSVLGKVVHALNAGQSRIPYRESKLTRILQDALGGTSVGLLICNIAPGVKFRQDTLNTLNFATAAKKVENKPLVNEQENRVAPKLHFAALNVQHRPQQPGKPLPLEAIAELPLPVANKPVGRGRTSLVPVARPRASRVSSAAAFQPLAIPRESVGGIATSQLASGLFAGLGLSEKEIDERISKAVEAEVARRLEERERERPKEEEERRAVEHVAQAENAATSSSGTPSKRRSTRSRSKSHSPKKDAQPLPPGILTPLLKRHKDLDDELKTRLQELEKKYERSDKEAQLVSALSPVSRKKTGRAYVALARAHSEKGDLQVALDLYRKAETYVPDNIKLKERIIEIEWAVKNNKPFQPSPKRPKKTKAKKKGKKDKDREETKENPLSDDQMDVEEVAETLFGAFGMEITNATGDDGQEAIDDVGSPSKSKSTSASPGKRRRADGDIGPGVDGATPAKKPRTKALVYDSDEDELYAAPTRKSKRKLLA
ncbi:microtubule motor [Moniliophthora roreri]|nr:microtubule motor [Moniliophthora roreri]